MSDPSRPAQRRLGQLRYSHVRTHGRWSDKATRRRVGIALSLGVALAGCSSGTGSSSGSPVTSVAAHPAVNHLGPDPQVWLCRPGTTPDPCTANLRTEVVQGSGAVAILSGHDDRTPKIDCFYVYPTVSSQDTANANLRIDPAETSVAIAQASRFSQVCRVFAPMYRQITVSAIFGQIRVTSSSTRIAYEGVLAAWKDYLARYNDGRGVVLIGHSQGSFMLEQLMRQEIDPNPAERRLLVSALLMGGNVTVPIGREVGGELKHIPACTNAGETGCVLAYSSFDDVPPPDSLFGRTPLRGQKVLCVNPAALSAGLDGAGATALLEPYLPTHLSGLSALIGGLPSAPTPWVSYPDLFKAKCEYKGGASWLQVYDIRKPGDTRPHLQNTLGPTWGLHLYDVNLALGNLVTIVGDESAAYPG
jgi:hypothetical protein